MGSYPAKRFLGEGESWAAAKRTIQAGVDISNTGDTVLVAPGIYDEGLTVTPSGWLSNRVVVTKTSPSNRAAAQGRRPSSRASKTRRTPSTASARTPRAASI